MIIPSIVPDSKNLYYKVVYRLANFLVFLAAKFNMSFSTGGNLVVKRDVFEELNGFDKTIFVGEDHDIVDRARKKGVRIAFTANPKVVFSIRRLEKEGGLVILKYFVSTIYIVLFGKMTKKMYNYEMGGDHYRKK
jgi:GT2 family glycosyltransferase